MTETIQRDFCFLEILQRTNTEDKKADDTPKKICLKALERQSSLKGQGPALEP